MAIRTGRSGTYNISTENQYISGYVEWVETYDDSTYISTNQTTVTQTVYLHRTNIYSGVTQIINASGQRTAYFDSDEVTDSSNISATIQGNSSSSGGPYTQIYSASKVINHGGDGSKTLTLGYYMTNSVSGVAGNSFRVPKTTTSVTLTTIPRQATLNSAPNFNTDENPTITYTNLAGNNVTELVAGIFDSNGWTAYAGYRNIPKTGSSYTFYLNDAERNAIRNASSNNQTTVRFYIRTLIGGTYYYSSLTRTATAVYKQAVLQTATDFTDEENPTITYSNVEGNNVISLKAYIEKDANTLLVGLRDVNKTGTLSYTFNLTTSERATLRQACTSNTLPVRFVLQTEIGGSTYWSVIPKTMTLVNGNPTFNDYTFADTNPTTVELTGNNQNIIRGYSNVTATVSTANKAIANKEATMSKYRLSCGTNASVDFNYSSNSDVSGTINNVSDGVFTLYAIDSRGNSKPVTKQANTIINYSDITKGNINASRSNGISTTTTLAFNGTWWNGSFSNQSTVLRHVQVGDDLSGKTLYFSIPDNAHESIIYDDLDRGDECPVIANTIYNKAKIYETYTISHYSHSAELILSIWDYQQQTGEETTIYKASSDDSSGPHEPDPYAQQSENVVVNLTSLQLPNDFGVVNYIDDTTATYQYIYVEEMTMNNISATYRFKKTSDSNWTTGATPLPLTKSGNNYSFSGLIAGDEGANGFDINYSYDIQVIVSDELSSVIFTTQLASGVPHIAYAKDGVGIMGKYDTSVGGLLQVGGKRIDRPSFEIKTLFSGGVETSNCTTAVGAIATLNESFKNYDLICIRIGTRHWNWTSKYEILLASKINMGTSADVRFVIPYSCYQDSAIYTIELGFTSETTLQIFYNSCVNTSGNGGFISEICGVKLKAF